MIQRVMRKKHLKQARKKINSTFSIYMLDVMNDIKVIEEDLQNVEQKCEKVNCTALYDAVIATLKLLYDLLFCCCKKKD
jgi:hypothetical protein